MENRWTAEQAWEWYKAQGWRMGANFVPSTASNQLEMWQEDDWDEFTIRKELNWASDLGFNSMRVFLHDLVFQVEGPDKYLERISKFLDLCHAHQIRPILVFFDSCWDPRPSYGKQKEPRPFIHNSRWLQSPGKDILQSSDQRQSILKPYIQSVLRQFGNDSRVLMWDLFNEPDNLNVGSYGQTNYTRVDAAVDAARTDLGKDDKIKHALGLLEDVFEWAREIGPVQTPLTVPLWSGNDPSIKDFVLDHVDVVSFHNYENLDGMQRQTQLLSRIGRPVICTEYMARPRNSTFDPILGHLSEKGIWAYNWGFVSGRSQTIYPWDSWTVEYTAEPELWFHDIFYSNGTPYEESEQSFIRQVSIAAKGSNNGIPRSAAWKLLGAMIVVVSFIGVFFIRRGCRPTSSIEYRVSASEERDEEVESVDESQIEII